MQHWEEIKTTVEYIAGDLDLELEYIQPWHLRLSGGGKRLDYFPKSGRATWVSSGKWFEIEDVEKFLYENFKHDTARKKQDD
jgi:hypothetical protein